MSQPVLASPSLQSHLEGNLCLWVKIKQKKKKKEKVRKWNTTLVGHSTAEFQLTIKQNQKISTPTSLILSTKHLRETFLFLRLEDRTLHVVTQNAFASDYS